MRLLYCPQLAALQQASFGKTISVISGVLCAQPDGVLSVMAAAGKRGACAREPAGNGGLSEGKFRQIDLLQVSAQAFALVKGVCYDGKKTVKEEWE